MAIPGWAPVLTEAPPTAWPLPIPFTVSYKDRGFYGSPSSFRAHVAGDPAFNVDFRSRYLELTFELHNVYDTVLVDRIE